jgi:hypothetical protein
MEHTYSEIRETEHAAECTYLGKIQSDRSSHLTEGWQLSKRRRRRRRKQSS